MNKLKTTAFVTAALLGLGVGGAQAAAQINTDQTWLGVNDLGHLNTPDLLGVTINAGATGVTFEPVGDATSPGCLCEGWGAAANGIGGQAAVSNGGVQNVTGDSFASTATTATSVTHLTSLPDLQITHQYQPAAGVSNMFEGIVTLTNLGAGTLTDVRYTRVMDWDIPPTEFSEFVTIQGTATTTNLLYSSDDGFEPPNPLAGRSPISCFPDTTDFVDCGPDDHGALFDFGFGDLAAGESTSFSIFYGAAATESAALAALGTIGAELFSLGQCNPAADTACGGPDTGTPATFIFAFTGVGGEPVIPPGPGGVPEPSVLWLMGAGLAGVAGIRRRKQAKA